MVSFREQASWYAKQHQSELTWYTHIAGVLLLTFSLILLFGFIHIVIPGVMDVKLIDFMVLGLLIYYFMLDWKIALTLTPVFIILLWITDLFNYAGPTAFALWTFLITFLLGCILQLAGHLLEGTRPAFLGNYYYALATPMFITAEIYFMTGKMNDLKQAIYEEDEVVIPSKPKRRSSVKQNDI